MRTRKEVEGSGRAGFERTTRAPSQYCRLLDCRLQLDSKIGKETKLLPYKVENINL